MNKKFLSAILFGALMVSSTGTFVSCKDYDDDIDRIDKELSEVKEYLTYLKLVQYTFIYIAIHLANVCSLSGKLLFPLPLGGLEKQSFLPLGSSGRAFTSQK